MHYRVEAVIESDKDEGDFALFVEGALMRHLNVVDLSAYEINYTGVPM